MYRNRVSLEWGKRSVVFALSCALFILAIGDRALADDRGARVHFEAGISYLRSGDVGDALREFERAHALSKQPQLHYRIALCHQKLGNIGQAIEHLQLYLKKTDGGPNRRALERRLEKLREQQVQTARSRAARGSEPPDDPEWEELMELSADELMAFEAHEASSDAPRAPKRGLSAGVIATLVVGGVGAVGAIVFGVAGLSSSASIAGGCALTSTCGPVDLQGPAILGTLTDISLAVAIGGLGTAIVLLLLQSTDAGSEAAGSGAAPSETARLLPWVDPTGTVGLSLRGSL